MPANCIFCQIIAGKAPAEIVFRDDTVTAFSDRIPSAPVHLLVVPNQHIPSLNQIRPEDSALLGHMLLVARDLAEQKKVSASGYRLVINSKTKGRHTIFHIHLHLLGGERLSGLKP
jgi:histidine triad (HIT) family protein